MKLLKKMFILGQKEEDQQIERDSIDRHQIPVFGKKVKEQGQSQEQNIDRSLEVAKDFDKNLANRGILGQDQQVWREE